MEEQLTDGNTGIEAAKKYENNKLEKPIDEYDGRAGRGTTSLLSKDMNPERDHENVGGSCDDLC